MLHAPDGLNLSHLQRWAREPVFRIYSRRSEYIKSGAAWQYARVHRLSRLSGCTIKISSCDVATNWNVIRLVFRLWLLIYETRSLVALVCDRSAKKQLKKSFALKIAIYTIFLGNFARKTLSLVSVGESPIFARMGKRMYWHVTNERRKQFSGNSSAVKFLCVLLINPSRRDGNRVKTEPLLIFSNTRHCTRNVWHARGLLFSTVLTYWTGLEQIT